jgi:Rrf2 family protein
MHITLESDYAVRIVHCLGMADKRMDARAISEQTHVTLRFSLKILRKLAANGIGRSYKGIRGGYELARELDQISLMYSAAASRRNLCAAATSKTAPAKWCSRRFPPWSPTSCVR